MADEDHHDSPQRKKPRPNEQAASASSSQLTSQPSGSTTKPSKPNLVSSSSALTSKPALSSRPVKKAPKTSALEKLAIKSKKTVAPTLRTPQDDKEDVYIAYLEAQLGIKKGGKKKKANAEEEDGLDGMWSPSFHPAHFT